MEKRLGKGLGALLSGGPVGSDLETGSSELSIASIRPNPHQPRRTFDPAHLEELTESIRRHGVLQPVVVRPRGKGYELISGERRWRASKLAGRDTVPAVVRHDVTDDAMLELALVENVQREDLNPLERARGYQDMIEALGLTQEAVAERVGLKRATIANHVRLLELPESVQQLVAGGGLSMGHARALLGLPKDAARKRLARETVDEDLSVRAVEERVRALNGGEGAEKKSSREAAEKPVKPPAWVLDLERRCRDRFGAKVAVRNKKGYRGEVAIEYASRKELERLMALLAPADEI